MAYDEQLAERIRGVLASRDGVDERKMFGGIAFLVSGNMAAGVRGDELMVRVDPDATDELIESEPGVGLMSMGQRTMKGWLGVSAESVAEDADLERWLRRGEEFAASLPPK
jgi:TfoX/Sxy family transcriptional regulator of competence genes